MPSPNAALTRSTRSTRGGPSRAPGDAVLPVQATLESGVPLSDVTFCVVDLETTGGSLVDDAITEIGAVRYRGGERLGSFRTLVNPHRPIPPYVTHLTGIDDRLVSSEPPIEQVLPTFLEFLRGCVFVAHNARFDFGFVNASCEALDYPVVAGPPVCTARLARRIVWPDVPNVRLQTLANHFRTRTKPTHRALDDAEACAEVFHRLLDLGGRLGILTMGDLEEAVRARGRPNFGKIALADGLPHAPGVYLFRGRDDRVLYVGKANDLRTRVRSYFYGDERKKVVNLLDEVRWVDGITCDDELEALVVEARLIARHEPPYNRRGTTWRRRAYLALDPGEPWPRLKVVRSARSGDGRLYLGPFGNAARARLAKEALEETVPIRRCTAAMGVTTRFSPCALADMGRCVAPCDGRTDPERYGELVRWLASSLRRPGELLEALERRMSTLADAGRYEEAASMRDRLEALAEALWRARIDAWLVGAGRLELRVGQRAIRFDRGALQTARARAPDEVVAMPWPRERADELAVVRSWISRERPRVTRCEHPPMEPVDGGAALARVLGRIRKATARRGHRAEQGRR
jgi:DNA polymerase III subunit epsilon